MDALYIIKDRDGNDITEQVRLELPSQYLDQTNALLLQLRDAYVNAANPEAGEKEVIRLLYALTVANDAAMRWMGLPYGATMHLSEDDVGAPWSCASATVELTDGDAVNLELLAESASAVSRAFRRTMLAGDTERKETIDVSLSDDFSSSIYAIYNYYSASYTARTWGIRIADAKLRREAAAQHERELRDAKDSVGPSLRKAMDFIDDYLKENGHSATTRLAFMRGIAKYAGKVPPNAIDCKPGESND